MSNQNYVTAKHRIDNKSIKTNMDITHYIHIVIRNYILLESYTLFRDLFNYFT